MRTGAMQLLDNYGGAPLCALAAALPRPRRPLPPPETVREILLIKMMGMGSISLLAPAVRELRRCCPQARMSFMTFAGNEEIVRSYCGEVILHAVRRTSLAAFAADTRRIIAGTHARRPDVVIDAEFFARYTALVSRFSGARCRIGFHTGRVYRGTPPDIPCCFDRGRHIVDIFLDLVQPLTGDAVSRVLVAPAVADSARQRCRELLAAAGAAAQPLIVLNPNVSDTSPWIERRWPEDHFAAVGRNLAGRGYRLAVIGTAAQQEESDRLAARVGATTLALAGKLDFATLLALLERALLVITTDSGPLHFAASLGVPTFSFFGTESPELYGHSGPGHAVFCRRLPCSPCLDVFNAKRGRCRQGTACMNGISPAEVLARFDEQETLLAACARERGVPGR